MVADAKLWGRVVELSSPLHYFAGRLMWVVEHFKVLGLANPVGVVCHKCMVADAKLWGRVVELSSPLHYFAGRVDVCYLTV
jgi:hypothetical protein